MKIKKMGVCFAMLVGLLMFVGCSKELSMKQISGEWGIDYERTLEAAKESPKYNPEDDARMEKFIKSMLDSMTIILAEETMTYNLKMADIQQATNFKVVSSRKDSITVSGSSKGKDFEMTFKLIDKKHLNMISSATDDMTYLIWNRIK